MFCAGIYRVKDPKSPRTRLNSKQRSPTAKALQYPVQSARAEYDQASQRYRILMAKVGTGTLAPGEALLQQAGEASAHAVRRYMKALSTLTNFERRDILPDDLTPE